MKKREFAIGEVFQFGLKKLKVVEDENSSDYTCKDCFMYKMCNSIYVPNILGAIGSCEDIGRSDLKNVHFVEVEDEE